MTETIGKNFWEAGINGMTKFNEWYENMHQISVKAFDIGKQMISGKPIDSDEFFETIKLACQESTSFLTNGYHGDNADFSEWVTKLDSFLSDKNPATAMCKTMFKFQVDMFNLWRSTFKESKQKLIDSYCQSVASFLNASKKMVNGTLSNIQAKG